MKTFFGASKKLDYAPRTSSSKSQKNSREVGRDMLINDEQKGVIWNTWKGFWDAP
jgi:hypothetical protein